jgi:HAD superfamily hydrolase (TIGR01509 family)
MSNRPQQIKAIIFDCFGVLVNDRWLPFRQKYFGNDLEKSAEAKSLRRQADSGQITRQEFVRCIATLAGRDEEYVSAEIDSSLSKLTDQDILAYIAELKPNYKIGFLSNAGWNLLSSLFTPEQVKLFDKVAISCETGFVKPDHRAYTDIASMLETPIEQCLLIDDQPTYCEGAREVGMQSIKYEGLENLKKDLKVILG